MVILLNMECSNEDDIERIIGGEIIEQYYICDYRSAYNNITRFTKKEDTLHYKKNENDKTANLPVYSPTSNSTMRQLKKGIGENQHSQHPQFGPINTYHLVATFKIRMGEISSHSDSEQSYYEGHFHTYEWVTYPLSDFEKEWPPSKF